MLQDGSFHFNHFVMLSDNQLIKFINQILLLIKYFIPVRCDFFLKKMF